MLQFDPTQVGIFTELVSSIAEEMGSTLERVAFSTNIKERRDFSCAVFDRDGFLVAQAAHIPVHLGAMEFLMRRWIREGPELSEHDIGISNDPYFAGTHLPDISLIAPVHARGERVGYVACRAHHADVGGKDPGSFSPVSHVSDEGVILRPSLYNEETLGELLRRSRNPGEREGDLEAQRAAIEVGKRRLTALAERYGEELDVRIRECRAYSESLTRAALQRLPADEWSAADVLEDVPEAGKTVPIRLRVRADGSGGIVFDFAGSAPQQPIGVNATEAVTRSACYYVVRCLAPDAPTNAGCFLPVSVLAPSGSIVNAAFPAPVVAGNTETSQKIADVILQALSQALPDVVPACSQGTMNNVALGTDDWTYYETIGGGCGAGNRSPGAAGWHSHMTNTANTPAEALELALPLRVWRYELRGGSGGMGGQPGGEGVVREIELLDEQATLSLMTERRSTKPPGAKGGDPGSSGSNRILRSDGSVEVLPAKCVARLFQGDRLLLNTPGGGGWGEQSDPSTR